MGGTRAHFPNRSRKPRPGNVQLTFVLQEIQAPPKNRGLPITFIFSLHKSYPKRLVFAETSVRFSSGYHHMIILASQVVLYDRNFWQI